MQQNASAQEFRIYDNGLIYSDTTMQKLQIVVDSLNLKYRSCEPYKEYYTVKQAIGYYVELDSGLNIAEAAENVGYDIDYDYFLRRYPKASVKKVLVVKAMTNGYKGTPMMDYEIVSAENISGGGISVKDTSLYSQSQVKGWVYRYSERSNYSPESLTAFYFPDGFTQQKIPFQYARMIQYADCMIDTSAQLFDDSAVVTGGLFFDLEEKTGAGKATEAFFEYVHQQTNYPNEEKAKKEGKDFWDLRREWAQKTRWEIIDRKLAHSDTFRALLENAINEVLANGGNVPGLEPYAERYYSLDAALDLMRTRIVAGSCSEDEAPREHVRDIAILSARASRWDVFVRAHLDIMNDRFYRTTDGFYAWGDRQTYIKELEELGIDVPGMLLGTNFRMENPSGNHYFGRPGRLGRALTESNDITGVEQQMAAIIEDKDLDLYNRVAFYFLYANYISYIDDKEQRDKRFEGFRKATLSLPYFFRKDIPYDRLH